MACTDLQITTRCRPYYIASSVVTKDFQKCRMPKQQLGAASLLAVLTVLFLSFTYSTSAFCLLHIIYSVEANAFDQGVEHAV